MLRPCQLDRLYTWSRRLLDERHKRVALRLRLHTEDVAPVNHKSAHREAHVQLEASKTAANRYLSGQVSVN